MQARDLRDVLAEVEQAAIVLSRWKSLTAHISVSLSERAARLAETTQTVRQAAQRRYTTLRAVLLPKQTAAMAATDGLTMQQRAEPQAAAWSTSRAAMVAEKRTQEAASLRSLSHFRNPNKLNGRAAGSTAVRREATTTAAVAGRPFSRQGQTQTADRHLRQQGRSVRAERVLVFKHFSKVQEQQAVMALLALFIKRNAGAAEFRAF